MSLEVTGKIIQVLPTIQVSDKFKKREFVIELTDNVNGNVYTNYAKFQVVQAKCEVLDRYREGDNVRVSFNLKGNKWERDGKVNYITNLDAWRIEPAVQNDMQASQSSPQQAYEPTNNYNTPTNNSGLNAEPATEDDLPF